MASTSQLLTEDQLVSEISKIFAEISRLKSVNMDLRTTIANQQGRIQALECEKESYKTILLEFGALLRQNPMIQNLLSHPVWEETGGSEQRL